MTEEKFNSGDSGNFEFTAYESDRSTPLDLTNMSIVWELSTGVRDAPLLSKSTAATGEIAIVDALNGRFDVILEPTDTDTLGGLPYYHEVEVTDVDGKPFTVFKDYMIIEHTLVD